MQTNIACKCFVLEEFDAQSSFVYLVSMEKISLRYKERPYELENSAFELTQLKAKPEEGLYYDGKMLSYIFNGREISIDFNSYYQKFYTQKVGPKDLLAKALGLGREKLRIADWTVGLGQDFIYIHYFKHLLSGLESNPYVYLLLQDALRRYGIEGASINYGNALECKESFDIIYIDPMYPDLKKQKTLTKSNMEFLKSICLKGDTSDQELLDHALKQGKRVVLKRPLRAEILNKDLRTHEFKGKNIRFDMYSS